MSADPSNRPKLSPTERAGRTEGQRIIGILRVLIAATVVLYLALAVVAAWAFLSARDNREALCALRVDLELRVQTSVNFLVEHPDGVAGIPAKTIQDGIRNQRRTIEALSVVKCPNTP